MLTNALVFHEISRRGDCVVNTVVKSINIVYSKKFHASLKDQFSFDYTIMGTISQENKISTFIESADNNHISFLSYGISSLRHSRNMHPPPLPVMCSAVTFYASTPCDKCDTTDISHKDWEGVYALISNIPMYNFMKDIFVHQANITPY